METDGNAVEFTERSSHDMRGGVMNRPERSGTKVFNQRQKNAAGTMVFNLRSKGARRGGPPAQPPAQAEDDSNPIEK